jgi:hypothetical protein
MGAKAYRIIDPMADFTVEYIYAEASRAAAAARPV